MQNWYSQNNPLRTNGVGVGKGRDVGAKVGLGSAERVEATAS